MTMNEEISSHKKKTQNYTELGEPFKSLARQILNENPEITGQKCDEVISKVFETKHEIYLDTDFNFILRFLRLRKFDVDKAVKQIVKFYEIKRDEKLCQNLLPSECEHIFNLGVGAIMPNYDKHNRKILILHIGQWNTNEVKLWDAFRTVLIALEIIACDPVSQITGLGVIVDFQNFSMKHLAHVKINLTRTLVKVIQETVPIRVKALYFINASSILTSLFATIRILLSPKIRKRFHVLSEKKNPNDNTNSTLLLHEFGPDVLPKNLGGTADSELDPYQQSCEMMMQQEQNFQRLSEFGFKS